MNHSSQPADAAERSSLNPPELTPDSGGKSVRDFPKSSCFWSDGESYSTSSRKPNESAEGDSEELRPDTAAATTTADDR